MSEWPPHVEACKNCTGESVRYAHGSGEYCNRCYNLLKRIKDVQGWDRSRPETLKWIPIYKTYGADGRPNSSVLFTNSLTDNQFEACRKNYIRKIEARLVLLRYREEIRRHEVEVNGLKLEETFSEILRLIRPTAFYQGKVSFPSYANYLADQFDEPQRRVIYALLEEVIEQVPWQGVRGVWSPPPAAPRK
jgi:hypothetical protein